jgi:hypothetical protein
MDAERHKQQAGTERLPIAYSKEAEKRTQETKASTFHTDDLKLEDFREMHICIVDETTDGRLKG